ncbi:MAG: hypothetical protein WD063_12200 [Pirellulales bacterium]
MNRGSCGRSIVARQGGACIALISVAAIALARDDSAAWQPCETATIEHGELRVLFRDNSQSPRVLSGVDALVNVGRAPGFDKLNLWSYDWPRYTRPFYFGRAARGMALVMMFDKAYAEGDEIRMSLFKFKVRKFPRPAFDWQYVIHQVEPGREYGFRARLAWKPFVDADDCRREYDRWIAELAGAKRGD